MIAKSFSIADNEALDDRAFVEVAGAHALGEERFEIVARGVHAEIVGHVVL